MVWVLLLTGSTQMPLYSNDGKSGPGYSVCSDFIIITGASNVNQFNFYYNNPVFPVITPALTSSLDSKIEISIPVKDFEAGNPLMHNDFLTLLKAGEYPQIGISFSTDMLDLALPEFNNHYTKINITIAGVTRTYPLVCSVKKCSQGVFVSGSEAIRLSDFDLPRPEKLSGLIKVRDELSVSFGFIINFTTGNPISAQK
jgi:hypothetical protein